MHACNLSLSSLWEIRGQKTTCYSLMIHGAALSYGEELGPVLEAPGCGPAREHFSSAQVTRMSVTTNCFPLTYDFPI